ncbi:hypothetical protein WFJ45_22795, partial [Salmonella enterica subsp. enterica serovar Minnesota]|uniref:hypothetical protein n=1 Tax=Salmonella enterica TaxID=28901 RepID=UPI003D28A387
PAYGYTPFLTESSAIAAAVALAWFTSDRLMHPRPTGPNAMAIAAWTWAFFWVHQELVEAFSPTTSTLLIISYYAATSVLAVWVGRTR